VRSEIESDIGNATPINLGREFERAAAVQGQETPAKRLFPRTPDTEKRRRLVRQITAKEGVNKKSCTSLVLYLSIAIVVGVFLLSLMFHEVSMSKKLFGT